MLKRLSHKETERLFGDVVCADEERLYFQALEAVSPWVSRGDCLEVQHATDGGIGECELAVVRAQGKYQLEVRPLENRVWPNQSRAIGRVSFVFRLPNHAPAPKLRRQAQRMAEQLLVEAREARLRATE